MNDWSEGDVVRVTTGPFAGLEGTVLEAEPGRAKVLVRIFGRDASMDLDADQLARDGDNGGEGGTGVREPRTPNEPDDGSHAAAIEPPLPN
jgi:KOW motif